MGSKFCTATAPTFAELPTLLRVVSTVCKVQSGGGKRERSKQMC